MNRQQNQGLYRSEFEHDACGVGLVANMNGKASHAVVETGLTVLKRLMHRGATGNDPETGDGAGLLLQIPKEFFRKVLSHAEAQRRREDESFGVGMIFGGEGEEKQIEAAVKENGCDVICWRDVPVNPDAIGHDARAVMPRIRQVFIAARQSTADGQQPLPDAECRTSSFEHRLYKIRREIEKTTSTAYICSLSSRTIVYKGLLLAPQVEKFYPDLAAPDFTSAIALVHQRYSTNTFPTWDLAHPFRMLAHNGEINTIKGNLNALAARGLDAVASRTQSDSASLDNVFELLVNSGRDLPHAMLMLMPQAWGAKYHMGHDVRGFFEYHSALMEPWDGPAAVAFTDGITAGAALDRNGLRPARWTLTRDGLFVLASETGVLDIPPENVARHGRLKPGSMVYLDIPNNRILEDAEIKNFYARRRPYRRWVKENRIDIHGLFSEIVPSKLESGLQDARDRFGWTQEDVDYIIRPMAETGQEPVGSMGNDTALPSLSGKRRSLFDFFHQLFAQVTNPPIDPIREELVMSLMTYIGNRGDILTETPEHARLIKLKRPVLTDDELERIKKAAPEAFPAKTLSLDYEGSLKAALEKLAADAVAAVNGGTKIVVVSDRDDDIHVSRQVMPVLLATAAVNRALVAAGLRPSVGLIVESGEVREVHHFAVLLGYGATAINPYLALATVSALFPENKVAAATNYVKAVDKGLLKTMSKMGISTLRSYRSAQIFEAVGLSKEVIDFCFPGTPSRVGGLGFRELESFQTGSTGLELGEAENPVNLVNPVKEDITIPTGLYRWRKDGEAHCWTPQTLSAFRNAARTGDRAKFDEFSSLIEGQRCTLRSLLRFKPQTAIPVDEVESVESIMRHFVGGAMSLGSLSPEAHETIARAFNSIGSMSNSGEGGENPERFGTDANCGIKQVASGRFGVTIEYLRAAKDIQIKLAQGAKPGEGGQLPAHKVNAFVARLRHAKEGTTLISPPPHHDIYSIEDLAQLIYDLKCANPKARISVKLVSEAGVGTIAAGVAKAHADVVLISGYDGGTGAAPLTSMKHAGLPWELGLAEAQETLLRNDLRDRVKLQVDGGIRTAKDVIVGAILGAEEFGFGTTLLVSLGCVQDRRCHCDTCPVGIATQNECLRRKFAGRPEHIVNFLRMLAQTVRERLASLGLRSLRDAIGRTDLLESADSRFDFSEMLSQTPVADCRMSCDNRQSTIDNRDDKRQATFNNYDERELIPAVERGETAIERTISNCDRSVGAALSGYLVSRAATRSTGCQTHATNSNGQAAAPHSPDGQALLDLTINFAGVAGQSFGAFLARGVTFNLVGEANDYVGKGISGGIITIRPPKGGLVPEENIIAGNVIAYGGTSGEIYINGQAGERFGIRNSGVTLVAEGIGDHGCEYMTGGKAVVLGATGVNFGAGMTGGVAYVLDESGDFDLKCNLDSIDLASVAADSDDERELLSLLNAHVERTQSPLASRLLAAWPTVRPKFVKVVPIRQ
ncbi:MAG: glutamate synthase large subunit [Kiritimatiellae bacterium]|nr:glutamate synthase large subunit [Kiritimatiellia bacterium]